MFSQHQPYFRKCECCSIGYRDIVCSKVIAEIREAKVPPSVLMLLPWLTFDLPYVVYAVLLTA